MPEETSDEHVDETPVTPNSPGKAGGDDSGVVSSKITPKNNPLALPTLTPEKTNDKVRDTLAQAKLEAIFFNTIAYNQQGLLHTLQCGNILQLSSIYESFNWF